MRRAFRTALVIACCTLGLLGLMELGCRLAGRPHGTFAFALAGEHGAPHPASARIPMYWGPIAFQVETDQLGFRCGQPCLPDPITRSRERPGLIALGDSFTYGFYVDENATYPSRLRALLATTGRSVDVFNFGIPGASIIDELPVYRHIGPQIRANWVFLQFYANDIANYDAFTGQEAPQRTWQDRAMLQVLTQSALVEAAVEYYLGQRSERFMGVSPATARFDDSRYNIAGQYDFEAMLTREQQRPDGEIDLVSGRWTAETLRYLDQYRGFLAALQRETSANGARLALVYVPNFFQVYTDPPANQLQERLQGYCQTLGIPFIDTTPTLRATRQQPLYLMPTDPHLGPPGLQVLAGEVERFYLQQENPLQAPPASP